MCGSLRLPLTIIGTGKTLGLYPQTQKVVVQIHSGIHFGGGKSRSLAHGKSINNTFTYLQLLQFTNFQAESMAGWSHLKVSREEVDIGTVLPGGQSFRWRRLESDTTSWIGVFAHKVWILKQTDEEISYKVFPDNTDEEKNRERLYDYLQLDISVQKLYNQWSDKDERFAKLTQKEYGGIRILNQDCVENVFSFICSANNNIIRISQMVEKLCLYYGTKIANVDGINYYDFPDVQKLTDSAVEKKLREEKFGYRAGYIVQSAKSIEENGGEEWLQGLKKVGYEEARKELLKLQGIGRKVADCICLMSLGYPQAIPIDTHIHQVAIKYLPHLAKVKTLTDKSYSEISDFFRNLHGEYAGWAQSVLFTSTLRHLKGNGAENKTSRGKAKQKESTIYSSGNTKRKRT